MKRLKNPDYSNTYHEYMSVKNEYKSLCIDIRNLKNYYKDVRETIRNPETEPILIDKLRTIIGEIRDKRRRLKFIEDSLRTLKRTMCYTNKRYNNGCMGKKKFKYPCLIRLNNDEIRNSLIDLGYKPFGCMDGKYISTDYISGEFETVDDGFGVDNILYKTPDDERKTIDCGTNVDLFLAIAALNDTDDYGQCFVVMEEYLTQSLRLVEKGEVQKNITLRKLTPSLKRIFRKLRVDELIKYYNRLPITNI